MADIKVNLLTLNACETCMDMLASAIQGIESRSNTAISNLRSVVSKKIVGTRELCDTLESCRRASSNLGALAAGIKRQYSDAETAVLSRETYSPRSWTDKDGVITIILNEKDSRHSGDQQYAGTLGVFAATGAATAVTQKVGFLKSFFDGAIEYTDGKSVKHIGKDGLELDLLDWEETGSFKPEYLSYKDKKGLGKSIEDNHGRKVNIKQKDIIDKQVNKDEEFYRDKEMSLIEAKAEKKISASVARGQASGSNDWAEGSVDARFLTAEAYATAAGGLYSYTKNKDGSVKRIFSPGVKAEVGASVAAFEVDADGRIGLGKDKNMLGVYGNAHAEALSAEAKAKIAVNSKEVYLGASAEANLTKVEGAAGVSVLGTDIGVNGALKVGVGAHANAGITDGKLKVDIGVACGVGFDLGFEIDMSGTVDAVKGFAESAWNGAKNLWNSWFG